MNQELVNLIKLQQVDRRLALLKKVEEEAPDRLAQVAAELAAAEERVALSLTTEQEAQKRRRQLEAEVADGDIKAKANQVRQLQAKNNDEYRALLKEAEYLRQANSRREDEVLNLLEEIDRLSAENKELKVWLEAEKVRIAQRKQELADTLAVSLADRGVLDKRREELVANLTPVSLALYRRIYHGRNGRAVVAIIEGICQECHLQIPPQNYNELQRNQTVMTCPNCERIMYWRDHEDFQGF